MITLDKFLMTVNNKNNVLSFHDSHISWKMFNYLVNKHYYEN